MSKAWTEKQKYTLFKMYATHTVAECAKVLRKSERATRHMARSMGLERLENLGTRRPPCNCGTCERCTQRVYNTRYQQRKKREKAEQAK